MEAEKCSFCGNQKTLLKEATSKKQLPVFACSHKKPGQTMPCDGYAYDIKQQPKV